MKILAIFLVLAAVVVAGCVGQTQGTGPGNQTTPTYGGTPAPTGGSQVPTLEILSPKEGEVISGLSTIGIRVNVTGIKLVDPKAENVAGEGHLDMFLDDGRVHHTPFITDSFSDVAVGDHTITVEIRTNDHSRPSVPVVKSVRFKRT